MALVETQPRLQVHIDATFPLARAAEARDLVAQGRTTGKVVLSVADPEGGNR